MATSDARIVRRAGLWGGKAVIAGTRIPVFMVQSRMEAGWSPAEIRAAFPRLAEADLHAVIRYAQAYPGLLVDDRRAYERDLPPGSAR